MDWYGILGCTSQSTKEQISKAARKLALKYHPDKNPDPSAVEIFQRIQKAKDFLTDDTKRKEYDEKQNAIQKRKEYDKKKMQNMDSNRKKMRQELESRMQQFRQEADKDKGIKINDPDKLGKVRSDGMRRRENTSKASERNFRNEEARERKDDTGLRQIKIKWKRSRQSHSDDTLYSLFSKYGSIEDVVLTGSKGNSAIITFSTQQSTTKAIESHKMDEDMRVSLANKSNIDVEKSTVFSFAYKSNDPSEGSRREMGSRSIDNFLNKMRTSGGTSYKPANDSHTNRDNEATGTMNVENIASRENIDAFLFNEKEILTALLASTRDKAEVDALLSPMKIQVS